MLLKGILQVYYLNTKEKEEKKNDNYTGNCKAFCDTRKPNNKKQLPEVFYEKALSSMFLKISNNSQENTCLRVSF